jgi:hypothetical protein
MLETAHYVYNFLGFPVRNTTYDTIFTITGKNRLSIKMRLAVFGSENCPTLVLPNDYNMLGTISTYALMSV